MYHLEPHHLLLLLSVFFLIVEIFTFTFVGGAISIGFLFSGIGNYLGASTDAQIILFIVGCAVGFFSIERIATRFFYPEEINTNSVIGSEGEIMNNRRIKVNGTEWNYKTENGRPIKAGAQAMVLSQKGSTLLVKSISKMKNN